MQTVKKHYNYCVGCSGELFANVQKLNVAYCGSCGGLHGVFETSYEVLPYINIQEWSKTEENHTYFDIYIGKDRIHGFYNSQDKKILQFG